jgi:hypothetical protein
VGFGVNVNMIRTTIKIFSLLTLTILLTGCPGEDYPEFPVGDVQGYKPVYADAEDAKISFESARSLKRPGKIYIYNNYLLVNERFEGIHVFDNTDKSNPKPLGFLKVYGNVDMALRNNILYVDHIGYLVALDVSNLQNIKELSRINSWSNSLPPHEGRYFECVDPAKGEVIGWVLAKLKNPECFK